MAAAASGGGAWGFERSNSGLSGESGLRRDAAARGALDRELAAMGGGDTPVSQTAMLERQQARMVDGVSLEGTSASAMAAAAAARGVSISGSIADDDVFVDTTTTGPVPAMALSHPPVQHPTSALRETAQPQHYRTPLIQPQYSPRMYQGQGRQVLPGSSSSTGLPMSGSASLREAAERIVEESLGTAGDSGLGSPKGDERLGRFYFEERK